MDRLNGACASCVASGHADYNEHVRHLEEEESATKFDPYETGFALVLPSPEPKPLPIVEWF